MMVFWLNVAAIAVWIFILGVEVGDELGVEVGDESGCTEWGNPRRKWGRVWMAMAVAGILGHALCLWFIAGGAK